MSAIPGLLRPLIPSSTMVKGGGPQDAAGGIIRGDKAGGQELFSF